MGIEVSFSAFRRFSEGIALLTIAGSAVTFVLSLGLIVFCAVALIKDIIGIIAER